jgi:hypothetical protein
VYVLLSIISIEDSWCLIATEQEDADGIIQVLANALQAVAIVLVFEGGAGFHFKEIMDKYGPEPIEKFLKVDIYRPHSKSRPSVSNSHSRSSSLYNSFGPSA